MRRPSDERRRDAAPPLLLLLLLLVVVVAVVLLVAALRPEDERNDEPTVAASLVDVVAGCAPPAPDARPVVPCAAETGRDGDAPSCADEAVGGRRAASGDEDLKALPRDEESRDERLSAGDTEPPVA